MPALVRCLIRATDTPGSARHTRLAELWVVPRCLAIDLKPHLILTFKLSNDPGFDHQVDGTGRGARTHRCHTPGASDTHAPPEPEQATRSFAEFTRPLCVYPKLGLYQGEGNPDDESSFRCAAP